MKIIKIITISILVVLSMNLSAQIKVKSSGKVGFGTSSPSYGRIQIGTDGVGDGLGFHNGSGSTFRIYRHGDNGYITRAGSDNRGIQMNTNGEIRLQTNTGNWGSAFYVKVSQPDACAYHLQYNGVNKFYVNAHGWLWCAQGGYFGSDINAKKDIKDLESSLDKVLAMRGVKYKYKELETVVADNEFSETSDEVLPQEPGNKEGSPKFEKERARMGLIAQEVETIYPDAVRTMPDGTKAIAYTDLIAVLIEAMKEQQTQIEELKKLGKNNDTKLKSANVSSDDIVMETLSSSAVLYQNTPNPFSDNTEIKYFLPEDVKSATLYIYNMQGNQIISIELYNRGEANETIHGSELQAGMYIYALIADGKEIDSKRMILTD